MCKLCYYQPPDMSLEAWKILQQLHSMDWKYDEEMQMWWREEVSPRGTSRTIYTEEPYV